MRSQRRADNSADLIVQNVKVSQEAQHSTHDFLRERFTFTLYNKVSGDLRSEA